MAVAPQQGPCFLFAGILSIGLAAAYYSAGEKQRLLPAEKDSPSSLTHQGLASGTLPAPLPPGGSRVQPHPCVLVDSPSCPALLTASWAFSWANKDSSRGCSLVSA